VPKDTDKEESKIKLKSLVLSPLCWVKEIMFTIMKAVESNAAGNNFKAAKWEI
jgi:hypothetical protein